MRSPHQNPMLRIDARPVWSVVTPNGITAVRLPPWGAGRITPRPLRDGPLGMRVTPRSA